MDLSSGDQKRKRGRSSYRYSCRKWPDPSPRRSSYRSSYSPPPPRRSTQRKGPDSSNKKKKTEAIDEAPPRRRSSYRKGPDPLQGGSASPTGKKASGRPPGSSNKKKIYYLDEAPPPRRFSYRSSCSPPPPPRRSSCRKGPDPSPRRSAYHSSCCKPPPRRSSYRMSTGKKASRSPPIHHLVSAPPRPPFHLPPRVLHTHNLPILRTVASRPPKHSFDPPDPTGLCTPYFPMFWFEGLDPNQVDNSLFYPFEIPEKPNAFQVVCRFLKQVRESGGYDVDCSPPLVFNSPFFPMDEEEREKQRTNCPKLYKGCVDGPLSFAIRQINADTGHKYKLVDVVRVVAAFITFYNFLTFTAADADGDVQTFRALVKNFLWGEEYELMEWKIMEK